MPTYEYVCTECGERLEVVQSFTDDPLTVCPACEGRLRKLFSAVGVVFKGSGFYKTDSRSGKKAAAASNGEAAKPAAEPGKAGSSGDSPSGDAASTATEAAKPTKKDGAATASPSTGGSSKVA